MRSRGRRLPLLDASPNVPRTTDVSSKLDADDAVVGVVVTPDVEEEVVKATTLRTTTRTRMTRRREGQREPSARRSLILAPKKDDKAKEKAGGRESDVSDEVNAILRGDRIVEAASSHPPPAAKKRLVFGGQEAIELHPSVRRVYGIIHARTGSIGGNGAGGPIYGELTAGSMQRMIDLMKQHAQFDSSSRFIDVGCGLGKPSLHVAQDPGVDFSYGIETETVRYMLAISNLHAVLKEAAHDHNNRHHHHYHHRHRHANHHPIGHKCILAQGDIRDAHTFDPFTHVYMFDIGFPPELFYILAEIFNRSSSLYLICYHSPRLIIHEYEFHVQLITQISTSMHGSKEVHSGYIYKRLEPRPHHAKQSKMLCDPLFQDAWEEVQLGLTNLTDLVHKRMEQSCDRTQRPQRKRRRIYDI